MFDHVEVRAGARNVGGSGDGGFDPLVSVGRVAIGTEAVEGSSPGRIASRGSRWLTPLVLIGLGCSSCDGDRTKEAPRAGADSGQERAQERPVDPKPDSDPGSTRSRAGEAPAPAGTVAIDAEVEAWVALAIQKLVEEARIDPSLPAARHLALLASPRSNFVTVGQLMDHTAHLGARAYEDFLRANPGSGALKAQGFLVALGADDTPGERPTWRRAHVDVLAWILIEVSGQPDLASALAQVHGEVVTAEAVEPSPLTPVRASLRVGRDAHARVLASWQSLFPGAASAKSSASQEAR